MGVEPSTTGDKNQPGRAGSSKNNLAAGQEHQNRVVVPWSLVTSYACLEVVCDEVTYLEEAPGHLWLGQLD